ncbi:hypothetical protein [Photobacterium kasasachensis]|uniref:hypothetical protein n=1 Tax=Photobacterium kasasachensis TaxID=2910240 RepID=UPI003D0C2810
MLDSLGESLGGLTDSILGGGEKLIDSWFDNEADKVASAAPEENRTTTHEEPAQQPTGQPIYPVNAMPTNLMFGGFALLMLFMFLMLRGK